MSNDLNQCNFIGRLGKEPETRYAGENMVVGFSIAVGSKYGNKEHTEWVNVTAFGKLAEICGQYLTKGSQVFISGRLQTDSWEDKQGQKRYTTKVIAERMQMLGGKGETQQKPVKQAQTEDSDQIPF